MSAIVMVALLWAAAVYRVVLSIRSPKTLWRSSFTACVAGVATAATTAAFGDQVIDTLPGAWNLAVLCTHLALIGAAGAGSIFVATLRHEVVPRRAVRWRVITVAVFAVVELAAWWFAPIHASEIKTTAEIDQLSLSGCLVGAAFCVPLAWVTAETAAFYLSRARSRADLPRTISLLTLGMACGAGSVLFHVVTISLLVHQVAGLDVTWVSDAANVAVPFITVLLASGILVLFVAPPVLTTARDYLRWRSVRPLWRDLVRARPEVHLHLPATGTPSTRVRVRLHRAIVEIHDALRTTPVSVPPSGDLDTLADALHNIGGSQTAAEVFRQTQVSGTDEADQLLELARSYARRQPL